jgi:hypothetical protein
MSDGKLAAPLDQVATYIRRYMVLGDDALDFLALWVAHTWAFEAAVTTPYARVVSPERASGKSRLLEVLRLLVRRPWLAASVSAAVVYRKGDSDAPTLLLDEIDQAPFADRRDLVGVLNAGFQLGAKVARATEKGEVEEFDAFFPKAFAGLDDGQLPDTLQSRSIQVRLERRRLEETVERFRRRYAEPLADELREWLSAWAEGAIDELAYAEPDLPEELSDREQDIWEPLIAIADLAGGRWPRRARVAAVALAHREDLASQGVRLLEDVRQVFKDRGDPVAVFSSALVIELNQIEEADWANLNRGEGLRATDLARLLRPYGIRPHQLRIGEETRKGYDFEQFREAWARYLRAETPETPKHGTGAEAKHDGQAESANRAAGQLCLGVSDVSLPPEQEQSFSFGEAAVSPHNGLGWDDAEEDA